MSGCSSDCGIVVAGGGGGAGPPGPPGPAGPEGPGLRYTVGPAISGAEFTTIQAAVDQAIADGASTAVPAAVYVWNGTYAENVTITGGGVSLVGVDLGTYVAGTITFTAFNSAFYSITGFDCDALAITGASTGFILQIVQCRPFALTCDALGANLLAFESSLGTSAGLNITAMATGYFQGCRFSQLFLNDVLSTISFGTGSGSFLYLIECIFDRLIINRAVAGTASTAVVISNCNFLRRGDTPPLEINGLVGASEWYLLGNSFSRVTGTFSPAVAINGLCNVHFGGSNSVGPTGFANPVYTAAGGAVVTEGAPLEIATFGVGGNQVTSLLAGRMQVRSPGDVLIRSLAELDAAFPPVGSVTTVTGDVILEGTIALPAGRRIVIGAGGSLRGAQGGPGGATITGDVLGFGIVNITGTDNPSAYPLSGVTLINVGASGAALTLNTGANFTITDCAFESVSVCVLALTGISTGTFRGCRFAADPVALSSRCLIATNVGTDYRFESCTFTGADWAIASTPSVFDGAWHSFVDCMFDVRRVASESILRSVQNCVITTSASAAFSASDVGVLSGNRFTAFGDVFEVALSGGQNHRGIYAGNKLGNMALGDSSVIFGNCIIAQNTANFGLILPGLSGVSCFNCVFTDNQVPGGPLIQGTGGGAGVINCTFTGNSAGGGAPLISLDTAPVERCTFEGNSTPGLLITRIGPDPIAEGCSFTGNRCSDIVTGGADAAKTPECTVVANHVFASGVRIPDFPAGGGGGDSPGLQTFSLDLSQEYGALSFEAPPTGRGFAARLWNTSPGNVITTAAVFFGQVSVGNWELGLYDGAGVLIVKTAPTAVPVAAGFATAPLATTLAVGDYWLAVWTNANGATMPRLISRLAASPLHGVELGPLLTLPASFNPAAGGITFRYWGAANA